MKRAALRMLNGCCLILTFTFGLFFFPFGRVLARILSFKLNRVRFVVRNANQPTQPLYQFTSRWRLISLALKTRHALQSIPCLPFGELKGRWTNSTPIHWTLDCVLGLHRWIALAAESTRELSLAFSFSAEKTLNSTWLSMPDHSITALELRAKGSKDVKSNCHWFPKSVVIVLGFFLSLALCLALVETASVLLISETEILQTFESPPFPSIYKWLRCS